MQQPRFTGSAAHATAGSQARSRSAHLPPDLEQPGKPGETGQPGQPGKPGETGEPDKPGEPDVSSLSWSFPGSPADVSCSRHWLAVAATEAWGECDDTDRLVLAYSEIATNAVVHGSGPVTVAAQIRPTSAHCEIADHSAHLPRPRHAAPADVSGRGLEMVQHTVDRLQVATDRAGKTVSFEVGRHKG